jgi:cytochrome P450
MAESAIPPNDILTRLLSARDSDTGQPMPDTMMVDNLTTFLEAGHQTTAQALSWALYLLSRAPAWQDALRAEAFAAAGSAAIDGIHIGELPLTLRVFKETMRLYPPVPAIVRIANEPGTLGEEAIPKGSLIIIPVFALHRHRVLWDDPNRFDPDRFLPEREDARPRAQYIPFGFGLRTCIGMPFAYIEAVAILATLLRRFRFRWDGSHLPDPISQITLHPKGGMPLLVEVI